MVFIPSGNFERQDRLPTAQRHIYYRLHEQDAADELPKHHYMARYVGLLTWTDQGIRDFRDTVDRADDAAKLVESLGGSLVDVYWTLGQYDVVLITEFPDDETATAAALRLGQLGNVRSTTLRAFNREEMRGIIGKAG
jgi:uncharacterized protein with GYD domain